MSSPSAALRIVPPELAERVRPVSLALEQRLPVDERLQPLLPFGIQRGTTVTLTGSGATTVALTVLAAPLQADAWAAVISDGSLGLGSLGMGAAEELGVVLHRLVAVEAGAPTNPSWAPAVAAAVDAFDVVLVDLLGSGAVRDRDARRLAARAKERGSVLVVVGTGWPGVPEVELTVAANEWDGLGAGCGVLARRRLVVEATGRRGAGRPRCAELIL